MRRYQGTEEDILFGGGSLGDDLSMGGGRASDDEMSDGMSLLHHDDPPCHAVSYNSPWLILAHHAPCDSLLILVIIIQMTPPSCFFVGLMSPFRFYLYSCRGSTCPCQKEVFKRRQETSRRERQRRLDVRALPREFALIRSFI